MPPSVRALRPGDDGVILTVDFGQSRGEAEFAELAPLLNTASAVHDCVAPGLRGTSVTTPQPADVLGRWQPEIDALGVPVVAVLGYCTGGPVARALAAAIDPAAPPTVVMLDTEPVNRRLLLREFRRAVDGLGPLLDDGGQRRAAAAVDGFEADRSTDIAAASLAMSRLYAQLSGTAFGRAGVGPDLGAELAQRVDAWLRYVAVAAQCEGAGGAVPATLVTSSDWAADHDGLPRHTVDVPREDLLRDPGTAAVVSQLLGG